MRKDTFFNMASEDNTIGNLTSTQVIRGTLFNQSSYIAISRNAAIQTAIQNSQNNQNISIRVDAGGDTFEFSYLFPVGSNTAVSIYNITKDANATYEEITGAIDSSGGSVPAYEFDTSDVPVDQYNYLISAEAFYQYVNENCNNITQQNLKNYLDNELYYNSYSSASIPEDIEYNILNYLLDKYCRDTSTPPDLTGLEQIAQIWFASNNADCCVLDFDLNSALPIAADDSDVAATQGTSSSAAARDVASCNGTSATAFLLQNDYTSSVLQEMFGLNVLEAGQYMVDYISDLDGVCDEAEPSLPTLSELAEEFFADSVENGGLNSNCDNKPSGGQAAEVFNSMINAWLAANYPTFFPNAPYSVGSIVDNIADYSFGIAGYIGTQYCPYEDAPDVDGCTDPTSANYNPYATNDDGTCIGEFVVNTDPTGNADNSELYATLLSTYGEYGNLIDDTIELIGNLQEALNSALSSNEVNADYIALLEEQLQDANNQLNDLLGSTGLLQAITNAVESAVDGNYDPSILANVANIVAPDGTSSSTNVTAINNALTTINAYYSDTSNYDQISSDLVDALEDIQRLEELLDQAVANEEDGITQADVDAVQANFDQFQQSITNALNSLTSTPPTGQSLPSTSGNLSTQVQSVVNAYNSLVSTYNNLASLQSTLEPISEVSMTLDDYNQALEDAADAAIAELQALGIPVTQAELDAYIQNYIAQNNLVTATDVMLDQATFDFYLAEAASEAITNLIALGIPVTQEQLDTYIQNYITQNNLVAETDVMMSTSEFNQAVSDAIAAYIDENGLLTPEQADTLADDAVATAIAGLVTPTDVMMSTSEFNQAVSDAIADYITDNGLLTPQEADALADDAVAEALEGMIPDTGQAATIADLQNQLANADDLIANLYATLGGAIQPSGTNTISNETLQAAYATIDQLIADAEAQFEIYANDIAAYQSFLTNLSSKMGELETYLQTNYGYDPDGEVKFNIPTNTGGSEQPNFISLSGIQPCPEGYISYGEAMAQQGRSVSSDARSFTLCFLTDENGIATIPEDFDISNYQTPAGRSSVSFSGINSMPIQDIYLNFAGKAIGVPRGFKRFNGHPPMLNVTGTETTFELKDSTKKLLWGAGIIALTFGALKLIKSK